MRHGRDVVRAALRRRRRRAWILAVQIATWVALAGVSQAANVVINNGASPPEPANVLQDDTYLGDHVYVRDAGCPPTWPAGLAWSACASPGAPTKLKLMSQGAVGYIRPMDRSEVVADAGYANGIVTDAQAVATLLGATVDTLSAGGMSRISLLGGSITTSVLCNGDATLIVRGGSIGGPIHALGDCRVWIRAGSINAAVAAYNDAVIEIYGSDFMLDGAPIPEGLVPAPSGTLSGTLASGEPFSFPISHAGAGDVLTGSIFVVEIVPVPALGGVGVVACGSLLSLATLFCVGRRRHSLP